MENFTQIRKEIDLFLKDCSAEPVVCFDFFDTLVSRRVMPESTKVLAANQLAILLNNTLAGEQIYSLRRDLEASLCQENGARGYDLEFDLRECGKRLYEKLPARTIEDFFPDIEEFVTVFLAVEIAVEKGVQFPVQEMCDFANELHRDGVQLVLVSDFYLPEHWFRQLLRHHNLEDLFSKVYVSADRLQGKGSGRLYQVVMEENGFVPSQMLMVGDNPHADVAMATANGLQAVLVTRAGADKRYVDWEKSQEDKANRAQLFMKNCEAEIATGDDSLFGGLATSLWLFIDSLFKELVGDGVKDILFLSREGEFFKKLFDSYQDCCFGSQRVKSHYCVASRKSTYIASLGPLQDEEFSRLFYQYRNISPLEFLQSLNLPASAISKIGSLLSVELNQRVDNFPLSNVYDELRRLPLFQEQYESFRQEQRNNLKNYISGLVPGYETEGLALVDVGWKGSIQDNIFLVLGGTCRVTGYYLGLLAAGYEHPSNRKKGIVFSEVPAPSQFFEVFNNNRALFEMALGASHGSGDGYFTTEEEVRNRGDAVRPFHCVQSDGGQVIAATREVTEELELYREVISPLQERLSGIITRFQHHYLSTLADFPDRLWFAKQHGRMVFLPTLREIQYFQKLYHLENFGVFEFTRFTPDQQTSWKRRLYNLYAVLESPALLEIGFWPPVILNHMGIGWFSFLDGCKRYYRVFGLRRLITCILPFG